MRPSSFPIGWSPPARAVIESRRIARPQGPSITLPSESGPRWRRVSFIAASAAGSGAVAPSRLTRPHIPHMGGRGESARDHPRPRGAACLALLLLLLGLALRLHPELGLAGDIVR